MKVYLECLQVRFIRLLMFPFYFGGQGPMFAAGCGFTIQLAVSIEVSEMVCVNLRLLFWSVTSDKGDKLHKAGAP